jgi:hypothetical protein
MKKAMAPKPKAQSKAAKKRESVGMKKAMKGAPRRGRPPGSKNKVNRPNLPGRKKG